LRVGLLRIGTVGLGVGDATAGALLPGRHRRRARVRENSSPAASEAVGRTDRAPAPPGDWVVRPLGTALEFTAKPGSEITARDGSGSDHDTCLGGRRAISPNVRGAPAPNPPEPPLTGRTGPAPGQGGGPPLSVDSQRR